MKKVQKAVIVVFLFSLLGIFSHSVSAISDVADCKPGGAANFKLIKGVCVPSSTSTGLSDAKPGAIIVNVVNWLMAMIGIVAIFMFVVSGWMYLTAGGDEKKTESAKNNITYTIIGVAVALTAFIIVRLVATLAGTSSTGVGTNI